MKKIKLTTIIFAICCVSFLAFLAFNPSHAYFQIFTDPVGINTAKVDLLFDKFTPNQEVEGDNTTRGNYTYGSFSGNIYTDAWGTIKNPYVMTGKNHVNNLFILQKSGYFEKKVDGNNNPRQSYFVVSNKDGTPIVIDCGGMNINPIGTPAKPFTGNIQGAPLTGDATYTAGAGASATPYTVTQSTIANLNVIASENTPDIGFFGYLGFEGDLTITTTKTPDGVDSEGKTVYKNVESATMDGFAASVSNLLFADVTIKTKQTVGENWWSSAGTRTVTRITVDEKGNASTPVTAEENIDSAHGDCAETHHIGIVSGHSEFATLTDISVYYSENVKAFDLPQADNSSTSFYSVSGILGTLKFVNPTLDTATGLLTSKDSVSDPDLEITGGGGGVSGSLTGYMLAKNIFDAYDSKVAAADKQEQYDTVLMTDIFKKVTMPQGKRGNRTYRNYYYFCDSIFTFAMSASVQADSNGNPTEDINNRSQKDYAVRIWPIDETADWNETCPPPITLATPASGNEEAWAYSIDPSKMQAIHKLTRITKSSDLVNGQSYALAYIENEGTENEVIHLFHLASHEDGFKLVLEPWSGSVYVEDDPNTTEKETAPRSTVHSSGLVQTIYVDSGRNPNYCPYVFSYNAATVGSALRTFFDGTYTFAIASASEGYVAGYLAGDFSAPTIYYETAYANTSGTPFYWNKWDFKELGDGTFKVTLEAKALATTDVMKKCASFYSKLVYNSANGNFEIRSNHANRDRSFLQSASYPSVSEPQYTVNDQGEPTGKLSANDRQGFAVFKLEGYEISSEVPYDYCPTDNSSTYDFNPSTDVLFYSGTSGGINYYSVEPLESKKWNDGNGKLLTELNHAIKMSQPPQQTTQIVIGNLYTSQYDLINNILGALFDESTGGTAYVPIGTTGKGFAIPAGTVAFDIQKASEAEPSFINIVVAINPGNTTPSSIGLWHMEEKLWNTTFTLQNPNQSFPLPISKEIISEADGQYVTHISNYTYKNENDEFVPVPGNHSTHLRGETVLVGYSFRVTTPGIYLMASTSGPMNVAYFSVDGAAGYGDDGTGAAPLGNIDFVYDNGQGTIITVDKKYTEEIHELSKETLTTAYYPSYFYLRMYPNTPIPDSTTNAKYGPVPYDTIYIRRYIVSEYPTINGKVADRKRYIYLSATDPDTHLRGTSSFYQDIPSANYPTT